ncbi:MAG: DsrE family protein [Methanoregula sp.]|nr:DsrE family protein [Methanoregula sp.]
MTPHILFLSSFLVPERLSWIEQVLMYHYTRESPGQPKDTGTQETFTLFLTGDALYSLCENESRQAWSVILSLPQVRLVCDRDARSLRGIGFEQIRERFPDRITECPRSGEDSRSFWSALIGQSLETPPSPAVTKEIGWLEVSTPYMHGSPWNGIRCLSAALDAGCGVSLFACLDGCHICHAGQNPEECGNVGAALETLGQHAVQKNLPCTIIASRNCASARGYATWDDGQGTVVSLFTLKNAHIRDLEVIIRHIRSIPVLLAENAGCISSGDMSVPRDPATHADPVPQVVILITHSPYRTEHAYGGITFAAACAHQRIRTSVVFIEDGIFALTGEHQPLQGSESDLIPELVALLSGSNNLRFYALASSLQKRGLTKNANLAAVTEIGYPDLAALFFCQPDGKAFGRTRILLF